LQVKIWFQNRRSKYKKLVKQHAGDRDFDLQAAACQLSSPVNGGSVAEDVCATPPSSSASSPSPPSPPASKSFHDDKQTKPTTAFPPEIGGTEMTSSVDHFTGVQRVDDLPGAVFTQSTPSVGEWTAPVGRWRTDGFEASPYSRWPTYGLNASASVIGQHGNQMLPQRSAVEQWVPMSGFDRRYNSGLVGAQRWYSGYASNTRHTSPV